MPSPAARAATAARLSRRRGHASAAVAAIAGAGLLRRHVTLAAAPAAARRAGALDAALARWKAAFPRGPEDGWMGLAADFFPKVLATREGKALAVVWLLGGTAVSAIALKRHLERGRQRAARRGRRKAAAAAAAANAGGEGEGEATEEEQEGGAKARKGRDVNLWRNLRYILRASLPHPLCKEAVHLGTYSALLVYRVYLTIKIAELTGNVGKFVGARRWEEIYKLQMQFGLWCVPGAVATTLLKLEQNRLALSLRTRLARHVHEQYYRVFYRASSVGRTLDTLDQRATADIAELSEKLTKLYGNVLKPTLEVMLYSYRLGQMIGPRELSFFFLYFVVSSAWLQLVMPPFGKLTAEQQKLEGELRHHHSRLLAHAEEIAFSNGGAREKELAEAALQRISRRANTVHLLRSFVGMLDSYTVKYGGSMAAFTVMMPAVYFGKRKSTKGKGIVELTGYYLVATALFKALGDAVKALYMSSYKGITEVAGLTQRVYELMHHLEERGGSGGADREEERIRALCVAHERCTRVPPRITTLPARGSEPLRLALSRVDVFAPDGALLVSDLNFEVRPGESLIIEGPNGAGKSSLLRTLCGLWPLVSGEVVRPEPGAGTFMFVPQRPYLVPGSLRALLLYPDREPAKSDAALDARLDEAMAQVGLSYLAKREGGWGATRTDWIGHLSGGEKQRLAIARLLYHRPAFAALDEATSAVSSDIETTLVARLAAAGVTLLSVSHRPTLRRFHAKALRLDGQGGWSIEDIEPHSPALAA